MTRRLSARALCAAMALTASAPFAAAFGTALSQDSWRPDAVRTAPAPPDPYHETLRDGFADLAGREIAAVDWRDARRFLDRAAAAAAGAPLPPEDPATRRLTEDQEAIFTLRRIELAQLIASPGARARAPIEIALLHLAYDDWLEAIEHGQPPGRADEAEIAFLKQRDITLDAAAFPRNVVIVMPPTAGDVGGVSLPGDVLDTPFAAAEIQPDGRSRRTVVLPEEVSEVFADALAAEPAPPSVFTLFFPFDAMGLDQDARAVIDAAVADIATRPAPEVLIEGHADAVGDAATNLSISAIRARNTLAALRRAVADAGLAQPTFAVEALGEREPVSTGPDEFALDRRVVIIVR